MNPVALITGGQQGIGLGIAEALAGEGFAVALASERADDDPAVVDALATLGPASRYVRHDLQNIGNVPALLDQVEVELGPVTTLVCNAGVPAKVRGDMLALTVDSFDFVLGVNLRGSFFLAQETAQRMLTRSDGAYRSIIFITSVSASMVSIERAEYCISKAGGAMMAALYAVRLAPHGIGVFELRPGIIETGMTAGVKDKYAARIEGGLVPAARWGQPADIGDVVVPLAEGRCAFATGADPGRWRALDRAAVRSDMGYDFIIVGGGSAGCVLAARLSENPAAKVLLLEAGGRDWHPYYHLPAGFAKMTKGIGSWGWDSVPQRHMSGRVFRYTQAKVIGGGSAINAQIYTRGNALDYDEWRQRGCDGWGYEDVLPYFRKAEDNDTFDDRYHVVTFSSLHSAPA